MINKLEYQELNTLDSEKKNWIDLVQRPLKAGQRVTDFKNWVYEESVGKYRKKRNKIINKGTTFLFKKDKKEKFEDAERIRDNIESFFQTQWLENNTNKIYKKSINWQPIIIRNNLEEKKSFESSKLIINNNPMRMHPEIVFRNKLNKKRYIIVQRAITRIDNSKYRLNTYHRSLQLQLWCYSWMNELIDAESVDLFVQFFRNNKSGNVTRLSSEALSWQRGNSEHESFCRKVFELYGGEFR